MKSWALLIKRLMPAVLTLLVLTPVGHAEEPARTADESAEPTTDSPWGFNLSLNPCLISPNPLKIMG